MDYVKLTREQLAARIARDMLDGAYVNLGIGMPTLVANHLPAGREIILQKRKRHPRHGASTVRRRRRF